MAGASKHQPNSRATFLAPLPVRVTSPGLFSRAASQAGIFPIVSILAEYSMPSDTIHGKPPSFSASNILDTFAADLATIKREDRLTYADLGALLGKSEDQAAKYCESTVLKAVLALSVALGDGNGITPEEVRQNRATLEAARDFINAQLAKLRPAA